VINQILLNKTFKFSSSNFLVDSSYYLSLEDSSSLLVDSDTFLPKDLFKFCWF